MDRISIPAPLRTKLLLPFFFLLSAITTQAQADLTRPKVSSVSPGLLSLDAGTTISAVFNEAMNPATISTLTFELRNALNGSLVPASVTYNAATRTARLYPSSTLNSILYTAKIKGGTSGVKDLAGNAMLADYSWTFVMIPLFDFTEPTILSVSPSNGATGVSTNTQVTAVFSETMNAATISAATFELRNPANALVPATISYNASMRTAILTPSGALATSTLYKATIKGANVKDVNGNALTGNYTWSFTTSVPADATPPVITSVSPANGALGTSINTTVSAVFNEAMNASTINSSSFELRNNANVLIPASVAYNATTRTATLTPSAPLASSALHKVTMKGGSSGVKDAAGNAMVNNYLWSFTTALPADVTPPVVSSVSPANGTPGVATNTTVSATFSEPMNASTLTSTTVQLLNIANVPVAATVSYNAATRTVTLTPSAALISGNTYTAKIKGGAAGVKDASGNALTGDYTWIFSTVAISIFQPTDEPEVPMVIDQPAEIGVKFRTTQSGYILGVRFYKGDGNEGTHIGHLWNGNGTMLAEANFTNETESGWQQVSFSNPVAINPDVTYVASYFSGPGIYSYTNNYFTNSVVNGPIRALADGEDGGNGVYKYTSSSAFPVSSFIGTNYFVDVMFTTYIGPDVTAPTVLSVSPVNNTTGVNTTTTLSGIFSEAMNASTINSSTVELRTASNALVSAAVTYNASANTVTLTPSAPLAGASVYKAKIKGGAAGVKDAAANALAGDYNWTFITAEGLIAPTDGPGGPILVISTSANPFSRYAVEILRAEGLNEFAAADISTVTAASLNNYDVAVLGEMTVTADQATMLTNWVNAGGTLIGFKPSSLLNSLFGLSASSGTLTDKYLLVNTASGPGNGIVNQTIQFHGTANLHTIVPASGAISVATLYSGASTATANPAVTMRGVGANGGSAVAFTYDLARSIIYTRQGNPAWAGQKRDGQIDPIRSDDMFFPDWIDFNKVAIPQADEQQRLLANIILQNNLHRMPLPRFWYLPRDLKAAVVMTGDNHGMNGTIERFEYFSTLGPNTPQDIADWKAVRGTSYIYPATPLTNGQAASLETDGFEIALHPNTGCVNYTLSSLQNTISTQLGQFKSAYPDVSSPVTSRTHCLVWSDWASGPKAEYQNGIRLDVNYYYWPEVWMQNRPGMFTGSGMPMRFADLDGSIIDVYQATTQMTDETNMNYTAFSNAVLDKAVGAEGYYGVFTANMHTDQASSTVAADAIIASATARQVPVISAKQLLTWLDARNGSSFANFNWSNNRLSFSIKAQSNAAGNLKAMLPINSGSGQLVSITRDGNGIPFTVQTIKGIQYAFFAAASGMHNYVADYSGTSLRTQQQPATEEQRSTIAPAEQEVAKEVPSEGKLFGKVMPNPSASYFNLVINSNDENPVTVRIMDLSGRVIETYQKINSSTILKLGHNWGAGTYFAELVQGGQRKVVKMVKVN